MDFAPLRDTQQSEQKVAGTVPRACNVKSQLLLLIWDPSAERPYLQERSRGNQQMSVRPLAGMFVGREGEASKYYGKGAVRNLGSYYFPQGVISASFKTESYCFC